MTTSTGGVNKLTPSPTERQNRKVAQASRTLKACELCRRQKTRCFRAPDDPALCLRCSFLGATCSFAYTKLDNGLAKYSSRSDASKLDSILGAVSELLSIAKSQPSIHSAPLLPSTSLTSSDNGANLEDLTSEEVFATDQDAAAAAPFNLSTAVFEPSPTPRSIAYTTNKIPNEVPFDHQDPVSLGLISEKQAMDLVGEFRRNYSRWISIPPESSTESVVAGFHRTLPLLLSVCCCLSLRCMLVFKDGDGGKHTTTRTQFYNLLSHVIKLLGDLISQFAMFGACHKTDGTLEGLQALVVISLYSISLTTMANVGPDPTTDPSQLNSNLSHLNLDAWQLSATALTAFVTKSAFGSLYSQEPSFDNLSDTGFPPLTIMRIYNHLCLAHLINCVFLGRMCVLDDARLNHCLSTLGLPSATNFDGRMVAEIGIIRIAYTFAQTAGRLFDSANEQEALFTETQLIISQWHLQWEHLFNQPGIQFVEMQYHFCSMLVRFTSAYHRARCRSNLPPTFPLNCPESLLSKTLASSDPILLDEMIEHASLAVKHVQVIENDAYFAYLLDQLHYCYYFCAIILLYLLPIAKMDMNSKLLHVDNIILLKEKFHTVSHGSKLSVLDEYAQKLQETLKSTFPTR